MRKTIAFGAALLVFVWAIPSHAQAATLLVSQGRGYGVAHSYGGSNWDDMTALLNTAFGGSGNITEVADFEGDLDPYDAIWLDLRDFTDTLTATEISNLQAFINSGKRVVLIGENDNWPTWNNSMLSVVGDTFVGAASTNTYAPIVSNDLTASVTNVRLPAGGQGSGTGATSLFTPKFALLYGDTSNVFVMLDVNLWDDNYIGNNDNQQFATNVANWIAGSVNNAPTATTPSSISHATDTGYVTFSTTITDSDDNASTVKVEYSDNDGSNWYDPILVSVSGDGSPSIDNDETYQVRSVSSTSDGNTLTVVWDTKSADNGNGSLDEISNDTLQIRVTPNDGTVDGSVKTSESFSVNNITPVTSSSSSTVATTTTQSGGGRGELPDPVDNFQEISKTDQKVDGRIAETSRIAVKPGEHFILRAKAPDYDQVQSVVIKVAGKKIPMKLELSDPGNPTFVSSLSFDVLGEYPYTIVVDYGFTTRHRKGVIAIINPVSEVIIPITTPNVTPIPTPTFVSTRKPTEIVPETTPPSTDLLESVVEKEGITPVVSPTPTPTPTSDLPKRSFSVRISGFFQTLSSGVKQLVDGMADFRTKVASLFQRDLHRYDKVTIKLANMRGKPLAGAEVTMFSEPKSGVTNDDGIVEFHNVEQGKHTLKIRHNGYTSEESLVLDQDVAEITISITAQFIKSDDGGIQP